MKKQIFKLTSILLAMVMVFTMFTIVPISAEEPTVDKETAVQNFVDAWKALGSDYVVYADKVPMNYIGAANNYSDAITDAYPPQAPESVDNRKVTLTTSDKLLLFNNYLSGGSFATARMSESAKLDDIKDLYFYYKSEYDISTLITPIANDGTTRVNRTFSTRYTLESTGDDWVKVSFMEYLTKINYSFDRLVSDFRTKNGGNSNVNNLSTIGFQAKVEEGSTADFYVSELFVCTGIDKNLVGTDNFTPDQWIEKAATLDLETLKSEYDTTDSTNWDAFEEAYNALKPYIAVEKLKTAAAKIVTSSDPVAHAAGYFDGKDRINFETGNYTYYTPGNEEYQTYGTELSPEYMLPAQSGKTLKGIWITGAVADMNNSLAVYFGDTVNDEAYISVYVKDVADANASPSLNFYTRWQDGTTKNPSGVYTVNVVKGETYEIKLTDILASNEINVKDLTKDNKKYIHFFALQAGGCDITVQVGAMMTKHYYNPYSDDLVGLTDVEFVKAMNDLKKGDDYALYSNTAEFNEALEVALKAFPEIERDEAVEKLKTAAAKMTTYGDSILYPAKYWVTKRELSTMTTSTDPSYGEYTATYTVPDVGTMKGTTLTGQWLTYPGDIDTNNDSALSLNVSGTGDAYITIKVNSITGADTTNLRFRYRANGTAINELLSFTLPVVEKGEYTFSLTELFAGSQAAEWKTFFESTTFRFLVIAAEGAEANITVGSAVYKNNYMPSDDTGVAFVKAMNDLKKGDDYALYSNTNEFEAALTAALAVFPEIEEEEAKEKAIEELRAAAKEMITSSSAVAHAAGYFDGNRINFETGKYTYYTPGNEEYQTYGTELSPEYMLPAQSGRTNKGIWITGAVADMNSLEVYFGDTVNDEAYISVYVKDVADVNASPSLNFYTRWQDSTTKNPSGVYTVNVVKGETYEIKLTDILASNGINVKDLTKDNKKYIHFFALQAGGCNITVQVGAMMTKEYYQPSNATDIEFLKEMYVLDADAYLNNENFKAKRAAAVELFGEDQVVSAKKAQSVINAASDLRTLGLKPDVYALRESETRYNHIYDASENGDSYITIDTNKLGNNNCTGDTGYVEYVPVTASGKLTLADLNDLSFAYKTANVTSGTEILARVYITMEYDDENKALVGRNHFASRNNTTQSVVRLGVTEDKWQTFSFADDLGDWRAWLLEAYTAGQNSALAEGEAAGTYTYDNVKIMNIRLGFNQSMLADISLGSMYISADNDYNITATYKEETEVLAEARKFNLTGVNKAEADEFKALVKDLENQIGEEFMPGYIAGNWYEETPTIKDLSVLSRCVDSKLGDTFIDYECANFDGDEEGKINEDDVIALRKKLLGIPDES